MLQWGTTSRKVDGLVKIVDGSHAQNIILIGFMGTGKTTVGKTLHEHIAWPHLDTDDLIEQKWNMPVSALFAAKGEEFFRDEETLVITDILQQDRQIITTGGGIILREENRRLLMAGGLVVALKASPKTILQRVGQDDSRPLLSGDATEKVARLLKEREGKYDFAHVLMDTSLLTPKEAAERIIQHCREAGWPLPVD